MTTTNNYSITAKIIDNDDGKTPVRISEGCLVEILPEVRQQLAQQMTRWPAGGRDDGSEERVCAAQHVPSRPYLTRSRETRISIKKIVVCSHTGLLQTCPNGSTRLTAELGR